jgi:hypothetical protein
MIGEEDRGDRHPRDGQPNLCALAVVAGYESPSKLKRVSSYG